MTHLSEGSIHLVDFSANFLTACGSFSRKLEGERIYRVDFLTREAKQFDRYMHVVVCHRSTSTMEEHLFPLIGISVYINHIKCSNCPQMMQIIIPKILLLFKDNI